MKQEKNLAHEFVEFIPDVVEEGKLYVSIEYATVVHQCCCGCGKEVVTPLSPTDWRLIFNGKTISLDPSTGNWSFPCRSHYWIRNNRVQWAEEWSQSRIGANRAHDRWMKDKYFSGVEEPADLAIPTRQPEEARLCQGRKAPGGRGCGRGNRPMGWRQGCSTQDTRAAASVVDIEGSIQNPGS